MFFANILRRIFLTLQLLVLLFVVLLWSASAYAGAWTQARGKGFLKIGYNHLQSEAKSLRSFGGIISDQFTDQGITLYGEYGVADRLTVILNLPFWRRVEAGIVEPEAGSFDRAGFSDVNMGVKWRLWQGAAWVFSASIFSEIPSGAHDVSQGLLLGDGEAGQKCLLSAGYSGYPLPIYASIDAGYGLHHQGYSDDFLLNGEIGWSIGPWLLKGAFRGKFPLGNGDGNLKGGLWELFADQQRYLVFGPEVILNIQDGYGLTVGAETAALTKNAPSGLVLTAGCFFKW